MSTSGSAVYWTTHSTPLMADLYSINNVNVGFYFRALPACDVKCLVVGLPGCHANGTYRGVRSAAHAAAVRLGVLDGVRRQVDLKRGGV